VRRWWRVQNDIGARALHRVRGAAGLCGLFAQHLPERVQMRHAAACSAAAGSPAPMAANWAWVCARQHLQIAEERGGATTRRTRGTRVRASIHISTRHRHAGPWPRLCDGRPWSASKKRGYRACRPRSASPGDDRFNGWISLPAAIPSAARRAAKPANRPAKRVKLMEPFQSGCRPTRPRFRLFRSGLQPYIIVYAILSRNING